MRIFFLHGDPIPSPYANGVSVMRLCESFCTAGHDVTLYAYPGCIEVDDVYEYYGVRHRFPIRFITPPMFQRYPQLEKWAWAFRVRRDIRRHGVPDLMYGRNSRALLACSTLGPFVFEAHTVSGSRAELLTQRRLFASRNSAYVVTITEALKQDLLKAFPRLSNDHVVVAPSGHDPADGSGPATELPGRDHALKIGYVGHLYRGRGIDIISDVARLLPEHDFHVVGGTIRDLAYWTAQDHPGNLYFHGHQPPAALPSYYARFDLMLAPYQRRIGVFAGNANTAPWLSPNKVFEYMAHGKPMIVSDIPVLREVLVDRQNCLLCPPEDRQAWKAAITELVGDDSLRKALADEAKRQLMTRYTWRHRVDRVLLPTRLPHDPSDPSRRREDAG
ncbi:glycosyltransferase family 4 protein [Streptomyces sp. CG4]|uniref:glycosyltransferase family 4 protein n=1 Tax=Streptomyces sp. CG4 TaxID=408783 RepID=UPI0034E1B218